MLKKLRLKFICTNMAIVTTMLCVIFGLAFYFTGKELESESIQMMQTIASDPFRPNRPGERPDGVRLPYFVLQLGQRGEVIATGGSDYDLSDEAFLQELLTEVFSSHRQTGVLSHYNLRYYHSITPTVQCVVFADMSSETNTLDGLIQNFALIGALSFLIFLVISLLLARWAVKPVDRAWTQQRQFVADASHELKTPLTVILTNAELLQSPAYGEADRARFAEHILTMAHQMRGLVEGLLDLARADSGASPQAMDPLDFSQLVSDAVLPFEPLCFEQELELVCQVEPGVALKGSTPHLRQLVDILLDNAMKYSFPHSQIQVKLKKQGTHCVLSVANHGEEISPADLKHIFQRFYRINKVRSMTHSYGLGLSIGENIVKEHRGKIWAESAQSVNTFYVELPILHGA